MKLYKLTLIYFNDQEETTARKNGQRLTIAVHSYLLPIKLTTVTPKENMGPRKTGWGGGGGWRETNRHRKTCADECRGRKKSPFGPPAKKKRGSGSYRNRPWKCKRTMHIWIHILPLTRRHFRPRTTILLSNWIKFIHICDQHPVESCGQIYALVKSFVFPGRGSWQRQQIGNWLHILYSTKS